MDKLGILFCGCEETEDGFLTVFWSCTLQSTCWLVKIRMLWKKKK